MSEPNGVTMAEASSPRLQNDPSTPPPPAPPPTTQPQQQVQSNQPQHRPSQLVTSTADGTLTNSTDTSNAVRPHDARTIHMVLASLGVTAYQERVPLQLLDFAYRYTSSVLSDAQHLAIEGYVTGTGSGGGGGGGSNSSKNAATSGDQITLAALRLATSSRLGYQFSNGLPKQTLLDLAKERNSVQLPDPGGKVVFGLHLPHERYIQTGLDWKMVEEWESEGGEEQENVDHGGKGKMDALDGANGVGERGDGDKEGDEHEDEDEDEDMEDGFETVFGRDKNDGADASMDES